MLTRSRWPVAALALSLALVVATSAPATAQVCELLDQLGACTPSEPEFELTPEGLIVLPGTSPVAPPARRAPSSPTLLPAAADQLLIMANEERARVGAPALTFRDDVVQLAIAHTRKLVAGDGGLFHNLDLLTKPLRNVLGALAVGENVGWSTDLDDLHARFMASPPHRSALLDPRFTIAGFAVIHDTDGRYYATQNFVQPSGAAPAAPAPKPPPPPPSSAPDLAVAPVAQVPPPPVPVPAVGSDRDGPRAVVEGNPTAGDDAAAASPVPETPDGSTSPEKDAPQPTQGAVAGLISAPPEAVAPSGRGILVGVAMAVLAAAALGQGWWWARSARPARS